MKTSLSYRTQARSLMGRRPSHGVRSGAWHPDNLSRQFNFEVEVKSKKKITLSEHDTYAWITRVELPNFDMSDEMKMVVNRYFFKLYKKQHDKKMAKKAKLKKNSTPAKS